MDSTTKEQRFIDLTMGINIISKAGKVENVDCTLVEIAMLRCSWVLAIPSTAHAAWWESHIKAISQRHQNLSQSKPRGSAIRIGLDSSNDADTNKTVMQTAMSNIEDTHRVKQVAESPIETDYIAAHGFLEIWDDTKWCSKYVAIFLSRFLGVLMCSGAQGLREGLRTTISKVEHS